uniref:Putative secreted protein n=1 Tax=Anopheles marajoara TaxID=58244 RepID=A0A2M4CG97_9DIPT
MWLAIIVRMLWLTIAVSDRHHPHLWLLFLLLPDPPRQQFLWLLIPLLRETFDHHRSNSFQLPRILLRL